MTAPDYVQINIVNKGLRPAKVTGVGWRIGFFKKVHLVQLFGDMNSEKLPKMLNEGEEANLLVKFNNFLNPTPLNFPRMIHVISWARTVPTAFSTLIFFIACCPEYH